MTSIPNTESWVSFFDTLRELPELWKVRSEIFKDRNKKNTAWNKLLDVYKEIDPNANVDSLKKRLTNIRTCYRRELRKVEQSQGFAIGIEEVYVPSLWYFESLDFLRDQEVQIPPIPIIDLGEDEIENDLEESTIDNEESEKSLGASASYSCSLKRKKSVIRHMVKRNNLLKESLGRLTNKETSNKDDAGIFAESWAASYRRLSPIQQIYAKKAIEEILVLGQLELLCLNSVNSCNNSTAPSTSPSTQLPSKHSSL